MNSVILCSQWKLYFTAYLFAYLIPSLHRSLSLIGKGVELKELISSITAYQGEPCCLVDPDAGSLSCAPLRAYLLQLRAVKQQYQKQVYTLYSLKCSRNELVTCCDRFARD